MVPTPNGLVTRLLTKGQALHVAVGSDKETVWLLRQAAETIMQLEKDLAASTDRFYEIAGTIDWGQ